MASTSSSIMDLLGAECPDLTGRRKRRRRRNKHVNPSSQRNLVKPPPKCTFRQPSLIDPDGWVVLVRCNNEEKLHEFDEQLPLLAPKAGVNDAILRSHGFMRLIYVLEEEDKKARELTKVLERYGAVFVGRTHKPFVRERTLEVHGLPDGIGYDEVTDALDCQFPGKSLTFDVLVTDDPRREPAREVLVVTHDASICSQLLNNGGLKLLDERLTFRCTERSSEAAAAASKWKKKKAKVVPEAERQCFKCLAFGHMAEGCDAPPRCKRCAGPHSHRECPGDVAADEVVACVNCGARDHRAVSRSCPLRPGSAQKKRGKEAARASEGRPNASPSPSPSDTGAEDSHGCGGGSSSSCAEGAHGEEEREEEGQRKGPEEPASPPEEHTAAETRSEDDFDDAEDFAAEASTEELRDSPDMASPAATASPRDDAAVPDFAPSGVSSTTGEGKQGDEPKDADPEPETVETEQSKDEPAKQKGEEGAAKVDNAEEAKEDVNSSNIDDADGENEKRAVTSDESEEEGDGHADDDVLYFTASAEGGPDPDAEKDAHTCKTASAVASFFSDLFGAADAPSKPLDGRFVATLRSLQESVYADIVARHPRRGPSSPRERKPAKKRRLAGPGALAASREAHTQTAAEAAGRSPRATPSPRGSPKAVRSPLARLRAAAAENGAGKASRGLVERRLRVLEQFLQVVNAILEIE